MGDVAKGIKAFKKGLAEDEVRGLACANGTKAARPSTGKDRDRYAREHGIGTRA